MIHFHYQRLNAIRFTGIYLAVVRCCDDIGIQCFCTSPAFTFVGMRGGCDTVGSLDWKTFKLFKYMTEWKWEREKNKMVDEIVCFGYSVHAQLLQRLGSFYVWMFGQRKFLLNCTRHYCKHSRRRYRCRLRRLGKLLLFNINCNAKAAMLRLLRSQMMPTNAENRCTQLERCLCQMTIQQIWI